MQRTLKQSVELEGAGLHTGRLTRLRLHPAPASHGIRFCRTDLAGDNEIPALWYNVARSPLCTLLRNDAGAEVSTVEHLMAALAGLGIGNATVDIDGPEVPILDGSAARMVGALLQGGLRELDAPQPAYEVLETVTVRDGAAWASLSPAPWLEVDFAIDFTHPAIQRQHMRLPLANGAFVRELADSRTFCLAADVERMRREGRALGGSLQNAVVFGDHGVMNPGGLRYADEPVRHKMLDAFGDLALAGAPILGAYHAERAGHALTNRLLHELFSRPHAVRRVECSPQVEAHLPGRGALVHEWRAVA